MHDWIRLLCFSLCWCSHFFSHRFRNAIAFKRLESMSERLSHTQTHWHMCDFQHHIQFVVSSENLFGWKFSTHNSIHSIPFHFRLNDGGGRLLSIQEISSFLHRKSTGRSSSDQSVSLPANSQQTNICSNKLQTNIHLHSGIMISAPFPSIFWSSTQHTKPLCVAVAATSRP